MSRGFYVAAGLLALAVPGVAFALVAAPGRDDEAFVARLPGYARPYGLIVWKAAQEFHLDPWLLARVIDLESRFGLELTPQGPGGTGDRGHGRGLAQIDDRTWRAWLQQYDWTDPETNIRKGASILADDLRIFDGDVRAALSAYNAGPSKVLEALARRQDPGTVTSYAIASDGVRRSYPDNVLRRLGGA